MPLTDTQVQKLKPKSKPYRKVDRDSLFIQVSPTGTKTWWYRFRLHGREDMYKLGRYPAMSLKAAREALSEARGLVEQGLNPKHQDKQKRAQAALEACNTFQAMAQEWINERAAEQGWSTRYRAQVEKVLSSDVYPDIGPLPLKAITPVEVKAILTRVKKRGAPRVAFNIRSWCSAIFDYAIGELKIQFNPAAPLSVKVPKTKHYRPLKREEISAFLSGLAEDPGMRVTKINLMLLLYLAPRPSELREARWEEFDLEEATWRPPELKMGDEDHVVPLPKQAIRLLKELKKLTGHREYLFPNRRAPKKPMNPGTTNAMLARLNLSGFSSHGFRATLSTHCNEMGWHPDVIERQLAHKERNSSRAAYNQAAYVAERRQMLQAWADYVDGLAKGATVTPIKAKAS